MIDQHFRHTRGPDIRIFTKRRRSRRVPGRSSCNFTWRDNPRRNSRRTCGVRNSREVGGDCRDGRSRRFTTDTAWDPPRASLRSHCDSRTAAPLRARDGLATIRIPAGVPQSASCEPRVLPNEHTRTFSPLAIRRSRSAELTEIRRATARSWRRAPARSLARKIRIRIRAPPRSWPRAFSLSRARPATRVPPRRPRRVRFQNSRKR